MRKNTLTNILLLSGLATLGAQATTTIIDDFESGDLSPYTTTVILDTDFDSGANTSALVIDGGEITFNTTAFDSIEQLAITRSDVILGIGDELQLDVVRGVNGDRALRGNQDFGLYVGGSVPTAAATGANDARANFITVFQRDDVNDVLTAVFNDDNTGGNTNNFGGNAAYDTLFITRTGFDTYEAGIYDAGVRTVLRNEVTITTDAAGPTIGFYADVRAVDILESGYDNLTIVSVPEPSSAALLGLGGLALILRRRK